MITSILLSSIAGMTIQLTPKQSTLKWRYPLKEDLHSGLSLLWSIKMENKHLRYQKYPALIKSSNSPSLKHLEMTKLISTKSCWWPLHLTLNLIQKCLSINWSTAAISKIISPLKKKLVLDLETQGKANQEKWIFRIWKNTSKKKKETLFIQSILKTNSENSLKKLNRFNKMKKKNHPALITISLCSDCHKKWWKWKKI